MLRLGWATLIILAASIGPLRADEAWTCTSAASAGGTTAQVRYRIAGDEFIESDRKERFRIVQNGEQRLVATSSTTETEPKQDRPAGGATTLILDKKSGAFMLSSENAGTTGIMTPPVRGTCVKD